MQLVDLSLQQRTNVLADCVLDIEALGPAHKQTLVDANLVHREGEGETQIEDLLRLLSYLAAPEGEGIVLLVVRREELLDLLRQKREELLRCLRGHEFLGNGDFALGEGEGGVAVQLDGADTEVGAAQVEPVGDPAGDHVAQQARE